MAAGCRLQPGCKEAKFTVTCFHERVLRSRFCEGVDRRSTGANKDFGFDVDSLTETLGNPLFHAYAQGVLLVDSVVEDLGSWASFCPCHRKYCESMTLQQRQSVMEAHYGCKTCPFAGCLAPEFAAGHVHSVLEELWQNHMHELLNFRLGAEDMFVLESDLTLCKARMTLSLQTKLNYCEKLPWLIAGCSLCDESAARAIASKVIEQYECNPAAALQHRRTRALMRHDSDFRVNLDLFVTGTAREELSASFRSVLAEFRAMPIMETTIEGRHARIALGSAIHNIGPSKVSLQNRMPLLERRIKSSHEAWMQNHTQVKQGPAELFGSCLPHVACTSNAPY
eukprot:6480569-Amphidinium_carterae.3